MTKPMKNILIIDDEVKILEVVQSYLSSKGYHVICIETGMEGLKYLNEHNISLVLLDLMLPDISGEEICTRIRRKSRVPIIMLTAKVEESDMLKGFGTGADDYITKPFSLKELFVRIEAVLRRSTADLVPLAVRNSYKNGDLIVDFEKNIFKKAGIDISLTQSEVSLTQSEVKILSVLIKFTGKVFTRSELIDIALGDDYDGFDRTVDSHVKNLRQKIEDNPHKPLYILTVHGRGYRFGGT